MELGGKLFIQNFRHINNIYASGEVNVDSFSIFDDIAELNYISLYFCHQFYFFGSHQTISVLGRQAIGYLVEKIRVFPSGLGM